MNCAAFRTALKDGVQTPESLTHMRSCASCLEVAVAVDPENLFRSLGGADQEPPEGIDAFVAGVMQQVHLRETEHTLQRRRRVSAPYRWAAAAALAIAVLAVAITDRETASPPVAQQRQQLAAPGAIVPASLPAVESYEEASAMIVELPAEQNDEMRVVMIFDETLPADL